jgi:hypothetical protein
MIQVTITLKGMSSRSVWPTARIFANKDCVYDGFIEDVRTFDFNIDHVYKSNLLRIQHYGKTNEDTICDSDWNIIEDKSVELVDLKFNGLSVLPTVLYDKFFYVDWPENIVEDYKNKGETPPEYITNNLYFGFNGTYEFDFSNRIENDYYESFWVDEAKAHQNQSLDDNLFVRDGEEVDIEIGAERTIFDLEKLINSQK